MIKTNNEKVTQEAGLQVVKHVKSGFPGFKPGDLDLRRSLIKYLLWDETHIVSPM